MMIGTNPTITKLLTSVQQLSFYEVSDYTSAEQASSTPYTKVPMSMKPDFDLDSYQAKKESTPFETWLVYVFQLQEGSWRIIHDQNTALDFYAFAKAAGIEK